MFKADRLVPQLDMSKVHLPTGNIVSITHIGLTSTFKNQDIYNGLYIPKFKFNLLSISKPTKELKFMVMFFPDFYIFQNLFSGQMKGIGREKHVLYVL